MVGEWVKVGVHNVGIPWTFTNQPKGKELVLCGGYTMIAR